MSQPIEIIRQTTWLVHWGGINQQGGTEGKLTECRMGDMVFWVRENFVPLEGSFVGMGSGERHALKRGHVAKRHPQVLDLCCPADRFDEIAAAVRALDPLGRPVRTNRRFTVAWAREQFRRVDPE